MLATSKQKTKNSTSRLTQRFFHSLRYAHNQLVERASRKIKTLSFNYFVIWIYHIVINSRLYSFSTLTEKWKFVKQESTKYEAKRQIGSSLVLSSPVHSLVVVVVVTATEKEEEKILWFLCYIDLVYTCIYLLVFSFSFLPSLVKYYHNFTAFCCAYTATELYQISVWQWQPTNEQIHRHTPFQRTKEKK